MKNLHEAPADPRKWPVFWTKDWIRAAMDELDRRNMDPEELLVFEMTLARNAHIMYNAERQMEKATSDGLEQGMQQAAVKTVKELLKINILSIEQIATAANVDTDFVLAVQAGK